MQIDFTSFKVVSNQKSGLTFWDTLYNAQKVKLIFYITRFSGHRGFLRIIIVITVIIIIINYY